jgi:phosphate starvation-inducible PhoH-like protein
MSKKRVRPAIVSNHFELVDVSALTKAQAEVLKNHPNQVLHGSAGTGKTFLGMYLGLKAIMSGKQHKLVIVRSAVSGRDIGFMPGNEEEKAKHYEKPYGPLVAELLGRDDAYALLKHKRDIEFELTSFLRGTTYNDTFILVDEIQNMTYHELDTVVTRVGKNCRIVMCGDYKQNDLRKDSGIIKFLEVIKTMNSFKFVEFNRDDIVRGDFVKEYIIAKEIYEESSTK